jgi:DNA-binding transcriptional MerR regulator
MAKALEAFRTIGEVSDELDVPKHVLRFWEGRFPQLKPMKRGGGRRFYRPEDVALLRGIHHLLHKAGYTIKGVQRLLREHGADSIKVHDGETVPRIAVAPQKPAEIAASAVSASKGRKSKALPATSTSVGKNEMLTRIAAELESCLAALRAD